MKREKVDAVDLIMAALVKIDPKKIKSCV